MRPLLILCFALATLLPLPAVAQIESNFRNGGGIIIGESTNECNADAKGALRYNDASKRFEGCNGTDGWSPLAQASPQLGTPLYAATYLSTNVTQYNNNLDTALLAMWGSPANPSYVTWRNMCRIAGTGTAITADNKHVWCGRLQCFGKTGAVPHMMELGDVCTEGGPSSCGGGHFYFSWNCLTAQ